MSYPAVTDSGEVVQIAEKHFKDGAEVFISETGRFFTRNIMGDVHQLIELTDESLTEAFGKVAAEAKELVVGEEGAVKEILQDTEDAFLGKPDHGFSTELAGAAEETPAAAEETPAAEGEAPAA